MVAPEKATKNGSSNNIGANIAKIVTGESLYIYVPIVTGINIKRVSNIMLSITPAFILVASDAKTSLFIV